MDENTFPPAIPTVPVSIAPPINTQTAVSTDTLQQTSLSDPMMPLVTPVLPTPTSGEKNNGMTLDNLSSGVVDFGINKKDVPTTKTNFGKYEEQKIINKSKQASRQGMSIPGSLLLMSVGIGASILFLSMSYMYTKTIEKDTGNEELIAKFENGITTVDQFTDYPGIAKLTEEVSGQVTEDTFSKIVSSAVPFFFKRKFMEEKVTLLIEKVLSDSEELNSIQKDIAKYGFLHPEIMSVINTKEDIIPIITSLHRVETVKFGTALKMFALLDTFLSQSSRLLGVNKTELENQMKLYASRGEKDVARFLSTCYLNPYEILPDCNQIDDFANYFRYDEKNETIDPNLLSKVLVIIDNKLEQSDLPSLQINFDRFSPNSTSLGFSITVNTLPEDEDAFLEKGIINPHIFIISSLVNLLKQSLFVIGDAINVKTLNIEKKEVSVGDLKIPISTSSMNFNLPLQNVSEREIYDFYDTSLGNLSSSGVKL